MAKYCILSIQEPCCRPGESDIISSAAIFASSARAALKKFLIQGEKLTPKRADTLINSSHKRKSTLVLREKALTRYVIKVARK